ncbi:FkbM family methyltransferase [Candidatus Hydrogenedentota bacterium]
MTIRGIIRRLLHRPTPDQVAQNKLLSVKLKKTDIAIDCGANVGGITRHLCKSRATVYSFEPNPHAFKVLHERFSSMQNVHCIQKGVSAEKGQMKLYFHENSDEDEVFWSSGSSLLDFKGNVRTDKYEEVEIIDLCEFIESLDSRVRILKIDVEGVECKILRKLINTGTIHKIDYAFVETHDHKIPELKAETDTLRELIRERGLENIDLDWI